MPKIVTPNTWGGGGGGGGSGNTTEIDWSGGAAITTASAASGGGTASDDVGSFVDLGVIHRLKVVANSNTTDTTFRIYADSTQGVLLYEAVNIDCFTQPYEDLVPFHYRDDETTTKFHYVVTNNGANNSTYTITVQAVGE